jgi:localization factor PodJL
MTQGPWSVKGIDPKARSIARERAQSRGVTLGQYLNTLLMDADEEGVGGPIQDIEIDDPPPRSAADGDLRRMSVEIDQLSQKLEASQTRSARAVSGLDKAILGLMGKVDVSGKAQLSGLERVSRALGEIETTQAALRSRIESVEGQSTNNATVSALKTLESALARLAETVQERLNSADQDNLEHRNSINDRVSSFSERVDDMARGLEQAVTSTVRNTSTALTGRLDTMEQQMTAAERRMEGALGRINEATSRLENLENKHERTAHESAWKQERALETNLAKSRQMSKEVLDKVEGIEEKTREAMNGLNDAVNRITERLARAERKSDSAVHILERSVNELDDKVTRAGSTRGQVEEFAQLQQAFQKRLDSLAEDIQRPIHAVRVDLERKLEEAIRTSTANPEKVERLERSLRQVQEQLQASEARQADAVEAMSLQVERLTRAVDDRLRAVEAKGDPRAIEDVRREMLRLADVIDGRMGAAETASRSAIAGVDSLRSDIGRLNTNFDDRMKTLEQRSASAIDLVGQHVSQQMGVVSDRLQRRSDEAIQRLSDRISDHALEQRQLDPAEIDRLADRLDERVRDSERRSAEAIGQIGEQVARVADRLQSQHQESLRNFETKLAASGRNHETRLTELMADMQRRMDDVGEQAVSAVQPMHNTISSLARRLEAMEDGSRGQRRGAEPAVSRDIPAMQDDFIVLEDDEPAPLAPPAAAAMAAVEAAENGDVIGVEPPPFDRARDNMLFEDGAKSKDVIVVKAEPANTVDDLLDTDDVIFGAAFGKAPPKEPKANDFVADLPSDDNRAQPNQTYIEAARRAAREGRRVDASATTQRKGIGKGPLIASAALAVAVAGGGALTVLRGKQEAKPDDFAKLDPSAPQVAAGHPDGAAADLFAPDTASHTEAAPTVASEAATAAELFGTPGAPAAAPGAKPGAPSVAAPGKAPAAAAPAPGITLDDAVRSGDPVALHDKALELLQSGEKQRAAQMLKDASNRGLVMAEYRLAKLYDKGEGVPRDMAASRSWTEKAAIGGNVKAMYDLGSFYYEGDAGAQSFAAAAEWFRQAADYGLVDSQYNLAMLYKDGLGLTQDKNEAAYWFEVAGRAGDQDAARAGRTLFADMPTAQAEQIKRRARAFSPKPSIARANGDFGRRPWDVAQPAQIAEIQRLLDRLGYNPGTSDGKLTPKTQDAIRAFENDNEMPVTGEASLSLLRQMRTATLNSDN